MALLELITQILMPIQFLLVHVGYNIMLGQLSSPCHYAGHHAFYCKIKHKYLLSEYMYLPGWLFSL